MNRIKYPFLIIVLVAVLAFPIYFSLMSGFLKTAHPAFLSDLTPNKYYQQKGELRMDRNTIGSPLSVNGYIYTKGIGTQANSWIVYLLDGRYRIFEGAAGLDDLVANSGAKIEALVYVDDQLIYRSGIMQGWINPRYFYVPIAGKKKLKLVINNLGGGNDNYYGDWLRIRLLP